ncbi:MAG: hypothetical protein RIR76_758 [Verrucomicrobiota bacterium]|jgi:hypothetical protein|nr:hypothetical protein [Opitutaceae bacterium]
MNELAQLTALCERLGAPPAQAASMAAQLAKRAGQIAVERGVPREEALRGLLEVLVKGRAGEVPARFGGPASPPPRQGESV